MHIHQILNYESNLKPDLQFNLFVQKSSEHGCSPADLNKQKARGRWLCAQKV